MSTHEIVTLDPAWQTASQDVSLASSLQTSPAWLRDAQARSQSAMRLEGPSTLVLAIIGVGTLIAYRSIQHRLIDVEPRVRLAKPGKTKPHRRAA